MEENKDLDIQEMGIISSDFIKVADKLKTATQKIIENKFSNFPIIIMSKNDIKLGSLFIDIKEFYENEWKTYKKNDYLTILPNEIHRMKAVNSDCLYMECSTTELDDVVRHEDDFERK